MKLSAMFYVEFILQSFVFTVSTVCKFTKIILMQMLRNDGEYNHFWRHFPAYSDTSSHFHYVG